MISKLQKPEIWDEQSVLKTFVNSSRIEILNKFNLSKSDLILDLGCGYGRTLAGLSELGFTNLIGIDYSDGMLNEAKRQCHNAKFFKCKIPEELPDIQKCQAVYFITVANCIISDKDLQKTFEYIYKCLDKNGILIFDDYLFSDTEEYFRRYINGLKEFEHYGIFRSNHNQIFKHRSKSVFDNLLSEFFTINENSIEEVKSMNGRLTKLIHYIGVRK